MRIESSPHRPGVLVVDDDATMRVMLTLLLEEAGYAAIAAAGADRALARLAEEGADLVLTDLVMPGRSGLDLLATLRVEAPDLPVVAMTGSDKLLRRQARELGARSVLRKPFELEALVAAIEDALGRRGSVEAVAAVA